MGEWPGVLQANKKKGYTFSFIIWESLSGAIFYFSFQSHSVSVLLIKNGKYLNLRWFSWDNLRWRLCSLHIHCWHHGSAHFECVQIKSFLLAKGAQKVCESFFKRLWPGHLGMDKWMNSFLGATIQIGLQQHFIREIIVSWCKPKSKF